jgi:hypothetical protein
MSLLNRFRVSPVGPASPGPAAPRNVRTNSPLHVPTSSSGAGPTLAPKNGRFSNGLKEFLSQLDGIGRGRMLDLGPACQSTLGFFIERGFKVYSEDLLTAWRGFLNEEDEQAKLKTSSGEPMGPAQRSAGAVADRFLAANLNHAPDTFDAVLLWDLLDYLDREAVQRIAARLTSLVRDGGAMLAVFHTRTPEEFFRYRVLDPNNLELVPSQSLVPPQHIYQNREIQDLFRRFRTSKTFVGRDQLREGVFVK